MWLERCAVGGEEAESVPLSIPVPRPMSRWKGDLWGTIGEGAGEFFRTAGADGCLTLPDSSRSWGGEAEAGRGRQREGGREGGREGI